MVSRQLKRQREDDRSSQETTPAYGLKNYLPVRPAGEDEASIGRHIQWMQDEKVNRPRKPDYALIKKH